MRDFPVEKTAGIAICANSVQLHLAGRSPRIVIRLLGNRVDGPGRAAQRAAHRADRRACCTKIGRYVGGRPQHLPEDDLLENPKRRRQLIAAMHHRLGEVEKRRDATMPVRDAKVGNCCTRRCRPWSDSSGNSPISASSASARDACYVRYPRHNIRFDAFSRVAHVTDATDWRVGVAVLVLMPDAETEIPHLVRDCIELGLHHHPARRRHRIHGRHGASDAVVWGDQYGKARGLGSVREFALPGNTISTASIFSAAGVVTNA